MALKENTKKKYYKDGNPELYKYFSERSWKNMTNPEKEMWTPAEEGEVAPIPKTVLDFNKQNEQVVTKDKEIADLKEKVADLEARNKELKEEINSCTKDPSCQKTEKSKAKAPPMTEDQEIKIIREELRKLDVKFAYNAKLPNLKAKLKAAQDANNTE